MKVDYKCINCILNYASELLPKVIANNHFSSTQIFNDYKTMIQKILNQLNPDLEFSYLSKIFFDTFFEIFPNKDYFYIEKTNANQHFLEIYDDLIDLCLSTEDPLKSAFKLCVMSELFSHTSENSFGELEIEINSFFRNKTIVINDFQQLNKDLEKANSLLFIHNYAGEIVFDKLFIKTIKDIYPNLIIHSAVKSKPVYKCATMKDAEEIFLKEISIPFESGSDYLGTLWEDSTSTFKNIFENADIIIVKGQANYESLANLSSRKPIYFSLVVNCKVISELLGVNVGDLIFKKNSTNVK